MLQTTTAPVGFHCSLTGNFSIPIIMVLSLQFGGKSNTGELFKDELTPSLTCSSHYCPVLQPPVLSATCGTLTCLQPGAVPRQTAGLSEAYTQRHTHTHRGTEVKREREGGCEGHIHRP